MGNKLGAAKTGLEQNAALLYENHPAHVNSTTSIFVILKFLEFSLRRLYRCNYM